MSENAQLCPDCGVEPGENHAEGCDVARCPTCAMQRLGCSCDYQESVWSGEWPWKAEARALNLWSRDLLLNGEVYDIAKHGPRTYSDGVRFHIPCNADDVGASEDLNTTVAFMWLYPQYRAGDTFTPAQIIRLNELDTRRRKEHPAP